MIIFNLNQIVLEKRKSTYSSCLSCYGIGNKTSKKLNAILLNHPYSKDFKHNLNRLVRTQEGKNIFSLPSEDSIKSNTFELLRKKAEIQTYKSFRQFQNLPSRGQRTHTNSQTSKKNQVPMLRLKINKDVAENLISRFRKLEYLRNGRSEEYNSFIKNEKAKKKLNKDLKKVKVKEKKAKKTLKTVKKKK